MLTWFLHSKAWFPLATLLLFSVVRAGAQPGPADPVPEKEKTWKKDNLLQIGGRNYLLRFVSSYAAPQVGWVERSEQVCLWADDKLYLVDPYKPKWQEPIACSWPVLTVSADRSRAVVRLPKRKFEEFHVGVVDLNKNVLLADFLLSHLSVIQPHHALKGSPWAFSPDGRWVFPLTGGGVDYAFFDVKEKKIHRHNFFPKEKVDRNLWVGAVPDGKEAVVFIRHTAGPHGHVQIPLADPTQLKFVKGEPPAYVIYKQDGKKLFCHVAVKEDAWIDTTTWQMGPTVTDETEMDLILGRSDPEGRWLYVYNKGGMSIYDVKTRKIAAKGPGHDGGAGNAETLGVTFNTAADVAAFATPYENRLTFLDTATHKVLARVRLEVPVSGAFLFDSVKSNQPGTCLAVVVKLPYEK
jgi:hypothetical protein